MFDDMSVIYEVVLGVPPPVLPPPVRVPPLALLQVHHLVHPVDDDDSLPIIHSLMDH